MDHMITALHRCDLLQVDETTVPVLAPGTSKVRTDYTVKRHAKLTPVLG